MVYDRIMIMIYHMQTPWFRLLQDDTWWPAQGRDRQEQRLHVAHADFKELCKKYRVPKHGIYQHTSSQVLS